MKVILLKDVKTLGFIGDVVEVTPGYAGNYLLPNGLATIATASALQKAKLSQQTRVKNREEMVAKSEEISKLLKEMTLTFVEKVSSENHLYGSVSETDIVAALKKEAKIQLDKSQIEMEHIKELGKFQVKVHLPSGSVVAVKVEVKAEEKAKK